MEIQGIFQATLNQLGSVGPYLNCTVLNPAASPPTLNTKNGEAQGILQRCFDPTTNTLRLVPV